MNILGQGVDAESEEQKSFAEMLRGHTRVEFPFESEPVSERAFAKSLGMSHIHASLSKYVASGRVDVVGGKLDLGNYLHMDNGRIVIVPVISPDGEFADQFHLYVGPSTQFGTPVITTGGESLAFWGKVSEAGGSEELMGMMRLAHAQGQEAIALPRYAFSDPNKPGSWIQYVLYLRPRKPYTTVNAQTEKDSLPLAVVREKVVAVLD